MPINIHIVQKGKKELEVVKLIDATTGKEINKPEDYVMSKEETKHFAYLIKDQVKAYFAEHWDEYVEWLETETSPKAIAELKAIKAGTMTRPKV